MDNFMGEYELVVQQMKALFLDKIYREQGLVSVLTDKVNEYDSDVQEYLKELFNKQSIDIETTLALMDEVANSVLEVQNTGNLIRAVIESGQIVKYADEVVEYTEEAPVEGEEVVEYVEEVPVEEESNNEVTFDSYELVDDAIQKFNKNTHAKAKAILVSIEQYSKLMLSRDTQKALFNSKNKIVHEVASVDDKESTTDNIVDNVVSDVEETYSDKQKQIEELMNKANQLYQDGKLDEAQELYNKISEINSGLDDSN